MFNGKQNIKSNFNQTILKCSCMMFNQICIKIFHQKKGTIKAFFVFELVNPLPAKNLNFLRQFSDKAVQKLLTIHVIISTRHNRLRPDRKYRDSGVGWGAHYAYPHTLVPTWFKVCIFWEGYNILLNLNLTFVYSTYRQK